MTSSTLAWIVISLAFVSANLPFSEQPLVFGAAHGGHQGAGLATAGDKKEK